MEDNDAQLHLKKRARRRLVGAVAFVALVAIALPMIMDHEPKPVAQDIEIRIPGQDEKPFAPRFAASSEKPVEVVPEPAPESNAAPEAAAKALEIPKQDLPKREPAKVELAKPDAAKAVRPPEAKVVSRSPSAAEKQADKPLERPTARIIEKSPDRAQDKTLQAKPEKPVEKAPEKMADRSTDKPTAKDSGADAKRAAAILTGKANEPATKGGDYVVLIGAFANEANVQNIRNKLGELGIKAYTEPLDSPQGKKTRVRAGPFQSREAADKAMEKMKRVGVTGVVMARQ